MPTRHGRLNWCAISSARPTASASVSCARPRSTSAPTSSASVARRRRRSSRCLSSAMTGSGTTPMKSEFAIDVAKENLKFSAAHFIAYPGFREPLHGHNYQVGVRVEGRLTATGYVLDFGIVKQATREIVAQLDERTLIPAQSDCLTIERRGN